MRISRQKLMSRVTVVAIAIMLAAYGNAQVQTSKSTSVAGPSTKQVDVRRGTVVLVDGNDLFVRTEGGQLRHFTNVPESARVWVNGKPLGIHDLKPGMKLERTIVTTTTPKTITTVQTVTGTVWHVTPPTSVILTLEDGSNQQFTIPKGQKFNLNGHMVDAWRLKKGMKISATKVVEMPETEVSQSSTVTGTMPAPPPDQPVLIAVLVPPTSAAPRPSTAPMSSTQAPVEQTSDALPKTGSSLPLIGLLAIACLGLSSCLRLLIFHRRDI